MISKKGLYLVLGTALISGFAVFLNKFAVSAVANSHILTTTKILIVALFLSLIALTPLIKNKIQQLSNKEWRKLILIGVVGGSIPFLLFFKGLELSSSGNAAFIHKTLFIWVALLAIPILKEKLSKVQLAALGVLILGNYFLIGVKTWSFGAADLLILGATFFWAVETIIAKKALKTIDPKIVAWGRMFFGAIFLLGFIAVTGQASAILNLEITQWSWIVLSAIFLLGYVLTWFHALKKLPVVIVTSVLVIASPITTALNTLFVSHQYSINQLIGSFLLLIAVSSILYVGYRFKRNKTVPQRLD